MLTSITERFLEIEFSAYLLNQEDVLLVVSYSQVEYDESRNWLFNFNIWNSDTPPWSRRTIKILPSFWKCRWVMYRFFSKPHSNILELNINYLLHISKVWRKFKPIPFKNQINLLVIKTRKFDWLPIDFRDNIKWSFLIVQFWCEWLYKSIIASRLHCNAWNELYLQIIISRCYYF